MTNLQNISQLCDFRTNPHRTFSQQSGNHYQTRVQNRSRGHIRAVAATVWYIPTLRTCRSSNSFRSSVNPPKTKRYFPRATVVCPARGINFCPDVLSSFHIRVSEKKHHEIIHPSYAFTIPFVSVKNKPYRQYSPDDWTGLPFTEINRECLLPHYDLSSRL